MSASALSLIGRLARIGGLVLFLLGSCVSVFDQEARDLELTPDAGAVVSEHPIATRVGLDVLERGGNAVDAAVATAFALAVVYPQAGNLGGGGFAVFCPHTGTPTSLDFREKAPKSFTPELYRNARGEHVEERSLVGPLASGVPGSVAGLHTLHRSLGSGRFSFRELVQPAVVLARQGFEVDPILAELLRDSRQRSKLQTSAVRDLFYPGGEPLGEGDLLVQSTLSRTLERVAAGGPRGFYRGEVARAIVKELQGTPLPDTGQPLEKAGMSLEDLVSYQATWREPLRGWFRGYELISMPPPSSGGVCLLQMLTLLEGFPLDAERDAAAEAELAGLTAMLEGESLLTERMVHWWIEAMRRAFADRAQYMGDPEFVDVPLEALLSREWIAERRISIGDRADPGVRPMPPPLSDPFVPLGSLPDGNLAPHREGTETTHLSVLDRDGNAVSLTTTLNSWFGSGTWVAEAGFFLNNELDDFAIAAGLPNQFGLIGSEANALEPGKRPLSSMTPTVVRDNRRVVRLILGSPGGPKIITAVAQVILRQLVLGQELTEAIAARRLHQQWRPIQTFFEKGWDPGFLEALERGRLHPVEVSEAFFGSVQGIAISADGVVDAVSDPRRGGAAAIEGDDQGVSNLAPKSRRSAAELRESLR